MEVHIPMNIIKEMKSRQRLFYLLNIDIRPQMFMEVHIFINRTYSKLYNIK